PSQNLSMGPGSVLNIGGSFGATATLSLDPTATFNFNGTGDVTVGRPHANAAFPNVTVSKSSGSVTLTASQLTIGGTFTINSSTFTARKITTGSSSVTRRSAGTITGASATHYIIGNAGKVFPTGAQTFSFPIGDATIYTPVLLAFANVIGSRTVVARTTPGEHP